MILAHRCSDGLNRKRTARKEKDSGKDARVGTRGRRQRETESNVIRENRGNVMLLSIVIIADNVLVILV